MKVRLLSKFGVMEPRSASNIKCTSVFLMGFLYPQRKLHFSMRKGLMGLDAHTIPSSLGCYILKVVIEIYFMNSFPTYSFVNKNLGVVFGSKRNAFLTCTWGCSHLYWDKAIATVLRLEQIGNEKPVRL